MKKTVNSNGKTQYVNPVGIRSMEPFHEKVNTSIWWVRINYGSKDDSIIIGSYADRATAEGICEHIMS